MYLARQVSQGAADRATSGEGGVEEEDVVEAMAASIVELELNSKEMGNEMFGHVQFTLYTSRQKITGRRFSWEKKFSLLFQRLVEVVKYRSRAYGK